MTWKVFIEMPCIFNAYCPYRQTSNQEKMAMTSYHTSRINLRSAIPVYRTSSSSQLRLVLSHPSSVPKAAP
jgi:hypothetical protein